MRRVYRGNQCLLFLARIEKERAELKAEVDDLHAQVEHVTKNKGSAEKVNKQLEAQLNDLNAKLDDAQRQVTKRRICQSADKKIQKHLVISTYIMQSCLVGRKKHKFMFN